MVKEVNRKPVTSVPELRSEVEKDDNVQLLVKRPNAGFVVIKISYTRFSVNRRCTLAICRVHLL